MKCKSNRSGWFSKYTHVGIVHLLIQISACALKDCCTVAFVADRLLICWWYSHANIVCFDWICRLVDPLPGRQLGNWWLKVWSGWCLLMLASRFTPELQTPKALIFRVCCLLAFILFENTMFRQFCAMSWRFVTHWIVGLPKIMQPFAENIHVLQASFWFLVLRFMNSALSYFYIVQY